MLSRYICLTAMYYRMGISWNYSSTADLNNHNHPVSVTVPAKRPIPSTVAGEKAGTVDDGRWGGHGTGRWEFLWILVMKYNFSNKINAYCVI